MLRQARAEAAVQGVDNVTFIEGDARDLPCLVSGTVDQVLKPGGRFVVIQLVSDPPRANHGIGAPRGPRTDMRMTPESVLDAVRLAGFEQLQAVDLPPFHYGILLAPA